MSQYQSSLIKLLELISAERVNVMTVEHHREGMALNLAETEVELVLAARDREHSDGLLGALRDRGYAVDVLR